MKIPLIRIVGLFVLGVNTAFATGNNNEFQIKSQTGSVDNRPQATSAISARHELFELFSLDIDADTTVDPLSDGLLVLRYLFSFRGDILIQGAISNGATRSSSDAIETYLSENISKLDIDNSGTTKPLSDGLLLLRYLFGFRGELLVAGAIDNDASRQTANEISAYIESIMPLDPTADADEDGVVNGTDNCPIATNADQLNTDNDEHGNVCDDDDDNDTLTDVEEVALGTNPLLADTDGDNANDAIDNCPITANADQLNTDNDEHGNACDDDDDNDTLTDVEEVVLGTNPVLADTDGDNVNDAIDNAPLDGTPVSTVKKAHRLLLQTTYGPTPEDIHFILANGEESWIQTQLAKPSAYDNSDDDHKTHLQRMIEIALHAEPNKEWFDTAFFNQSLAGRAADDYQLSAWLENALGHPINTTHADDQLRQRVAYALSQIVVVSDSAPPLNHRAEGLASYYDILARNAFGSYRTLLGEIARSPAMGVFLSHQGNKKADAIAKTRPDENFARELIQLFSIGLYELNVDGSANRDADPATYPDSGTHLIPAYTQIDVEELAKVMTGWDLFDNDFYGQIRETEGVYSQPMEFTPSEHEDEVEEAGDGQVTVMGATLDLDSGADGSGMDAALDIIFNHPNIAPFISRHLIMRLVTSNPSSNYIARVASVFNDNGNGVKGDLKAVVESILMDPEARDINNLTNPTFGKAKETLLAWTQFLRAFRIRPLDGWISRDSNSVVNGVYLFRDPTEHLGQAPLRSPSVFNFYSPDFVPSNDFFANNKLVVPELQIQTNHILVEFNNEIYTRVHFFEANKITGEDEQSLAEFGASKSYASGNLMLIDFNKELEIYEQALDGDTNGDFVNMEAVDPEDDTRYKAKAIDALLTHLDRVLLGETMTTEYKAALKHYLLNAAGASNSDNFKEARRNISDAVRLIVTSSEFMIQK